MKRKIVHIDEEKCNGCGLCVPSCAEGALKIIDGKARLVSDVYCDGLGACLGTCPQDAITVEEREAEAFDEAAVEQYLDSTRKPEAPRKDPAPCACPGSALRDLAAKIAGEPDPEPSPSPEKPTAASQLRSWPVQLRLVPPAAPFLAGADIIVCADCVPFAVPDFHKRYLSKGVVLVGCPKLDDNAYYREKLEHIFAVANPASVTVLRMEVPCCSGLAMAARQAHAAAEADCPLTVHTIGISGGVTVEEEPLTV